MEKRIMGRTKRDILKRAMAQAVHHNHVSQERVYDLLEVFQAQHPEHAAYLASIITSLDIAERMMLDFWDRSWGPHPDNIDVYRQ